MVTCNNPIWCSDWVPHIVGPHFAVSVHLSLVWSIRHVGTPDSALIGGDVPHRDEWDQKRKGLIAQCRIKTFIGSTK